MQEHRLIDSFNYALEGIIHSLKTQRNMKIHFVVAFLVLLASLFLEVTKVQLIILFLAITFVIAMELVNTAIEVVIDMICEEYRFRAKIAKNMAAGAVFMAALNAIIIGYLIFLDDIKGFSLSLINQIKQDPAHLTFIDLGIIVIIILLLKSLGGRGTPLQGGMPSGHAALSFALATIVVFLTSDILVASLVYLLAFIVGQSRIQSHTHSLMEVITGALIGIIVTVIIFQFL
ncbi:diacylglycerol kinase [Halothermothrix orenii]|uniref:Diacylglycerol kinase n=1 Tax=Halothermothrix orenii (strain H 168 / OCM 544 / DSM 9562) TaxID=373903 RepID=B8CXI8_HALOH|nr:diacylglycerol kinase [Halothermothrix orenii]ACL70007.1 Diacylglycerol kinase [Halothermothrix orenii H 168]